MWNNYVPDAPWIGNPEWRMYTVAEEEDEEEEEEDENYES